LVAARSEKQCADNFLQAKRRANEVRFILRSFNRGNFAISTVSVSSPEPYAVVIRVVALLSALVFFHFTTELAFAGEPGSDCGTPSDIHDGWMIGSPEQ
jgi:hypothetical protein